MPDLITLPPQFVNMYQHQALHVLITEFKALDKKLDNLEYETRKLIILKIIKERLRLKLHMTNEPINIPPEVIPDYKQNIMQFVYRFCLVFGCFEKAAGSFLFGSNLFILIPGISHFSLYALTTIYTLLDALLFYAFEVSFLKKALGVVLTENGACLLNETYKEQLQTTIEINIILNRRETFDWNADEYLAYCEAMKLFNAHLIKKHSGMKKHSTTMLKRCIENAVVLFGALSSVADSYFMAKTALVTLHISFMSSPLGCALVIAIVVSALVFYYAMGMKSMSELLNPERKSHNSLLEGLTLFRKEYEKREPYQPKGIPDASSKQSLTNHSGSMMIEGASIYKASRR